MAELIAVLPWALFVIAAPVLLRRRPRLEDYPNEGAGDSTAPLISIIVPARNEALNLGTCVATLLDTTYPNFEIILVDDRSTDGTGELARALAERSDGVVRVVEGAPLPRGWVGKPWACWQGYHAARGELLLFTDADTRHGDELLGRAAGALHGEGADMVSVLPWQHVDSFWERLIMPQVLLAIRLRYPDLGRVNRATDPAAAIANGQFILVRRDAYERVGGHEAVKREVVEDLRLAQEFISSGRRLFLAHAERYMTTRMYRSLGHIVEGWSKNLALGSRLAAPRLRSLTPWLAASFLVLFWIVPPLVMIAAFFNIVPGLLAWSGTVTAVSILFWAGIFLSHRIPALYALLYPFGAGVTAWLFARSAARGERVEWKGRSYGRARSVERPAL